MTQPTLEQVIDTATDIIGYSDDCILILEIGNNITIGIDLQELTEDYELDIDGNFEQDIRNALYSEVEAQLESATHDALEQIKPKLLTRVK